MVPFALLWIIGRTYNELQIGAFLIVQSISAFSSIFIEYGFHLSAVRKASTALTEKRLGDYLFDVHMSKLLLSVVAVPISLCFIYFYVEQGHFGLFASCSIMLMLSVGFRPLWIFQALGSYDKLVKFELAATVASLAASSFAAISGAAIEWALFAWALPKFIFTSSLILQLHRTHKGKIPNFNNVKLEIFENSKFFLSKSCSSIIHLSIPSILIIYSGPHSALMFQKAERIYTALQSFLFIISQVLFPKIIDMNNDINSKRNILNYNIIYISTSLFASLILFTFSPYIIAILWGSPDEKASEILRILAVSIPIIHISTAVCINYFLPAQKDAYFVIPSVVGAATALILLLLFSFAATAKGGAQAIVLSESMVLLMVGALWFKWMRSQKGDLSRKD